MSQDEIKSIIRKYRLRAVFILGTFLMFAILSNFILINNNIQHRAELGLPLVNYESGFIWGAITLGLFTVLKLCFYSFEQILLKVLAKPKKD